MQQPAIEENIPRADAFSFVVIRAEWHSDITSVLEKSAMDALIANGAGIHNIKTVTVPGSYELTAAAAFFASQKKHHAVICLGCVIQGETRHFEFICNAVANGLSNVSIKHNVPVIFGVLTTDTLQQAHERSNGSHGSKGAEAAIAAIKMAHLFHENKN